METVNHTVTQIVNVASNAIWGENSTGKNQTNVPHGEEPISGVQGKGVVNDPYDAGNRDEQPDAPASDGNTAPQDPKFAGSSVNHGNVSTPNASGSSISGLKTDSAIAIPTPIAEQRLNEPAESQGSTAPASSSTEPGSGSSSKAADHSHVSEEALKGPQGPAKYSAEQFEKDEKLAKQNKGRSKEGKEGKDSAPKRSDSFGGSSKSNSSKSNGQSEGSGSSNGNGKTSPMAKVKHTLNKVAHPRRNSQKSTSSE